MKNPYSLKAKTLIFFFFLTSFFYSQNLILKNVNLIPINKDTVIKNVNLYITDGLIDKIVATKVILPFKDYPIIDGTDKYLIPGMADMHAHLPDSASPFTIQNYLNLQLSAGVTTIRSMRGNENQLSLRDSINKKMIVAPEIFVSFVFPEVDSLLTKEKIEDLVFNAKIKKYDFIKYLGGIKQKHMEVLALSCDMYKIPIAGHAYNKSIQESMNFDFVSIEHFQPILASYYQDSLKFNKTIDYLNLKHTALCPTLSFYSVFSFLNSENDLLARNGISLLPQTIKDSWLTEYNKALNETKEGLKDDFESKYLNAYKKRFADFNKILKQLADNNTLLLLSPDESAFNVPGFSMVEEMKLYANAGLSNYQILKITTLNAARFLKKERYYGAIEIGKQANLVLLNANPLDNIENIKQIEGTLLNGKFYLQKTILEKIKLN